MKNKSTYSDFLRQENEITKLKIQAEFGLVLNDGNGLNPAIENIWLNHILDFERSMLNCEQVTIREKLGNPEFKPVDQVKDEEMIESLHMMMEVLHRGNIVIDSIAGASDREMYRFITEELLDQEIDKKTPPNMLTCFIYEEFHANHEYDIKMLSQELVQALTFDKEPDFDRYIISANNDEDAEIKKETIKRKLSLFKNAFDEIKVEKYEILEVKIADNDAEVLFDYDISLLPAESRSRFEVSGKGKFSFKYKNDFWSIVDVDMKGVV